MYVKIIHHKDKKAADKRPRTLLFECSYADFNPVTDKGDHAWEVWMYQQGKSTPLYVRLVHLGIDEVLMMNQQGKTIDRFE